MRTINQPLACSFRCARRTLQRFVIIIRDPLTMEAQGGVEGSGLSMRQIAKRLKTSVPQLYRLLDPANTRKSMSQLVALLHVLDRDVDLVVKKKVAA